MEKQQAELEINMIKKIMDDSRKIVIDDGLGYIIWGILVMAGLIATYAEIISHNYQFISWTWIILMGGGWTYTIIINVKKERGRKVKTFAGKILGGLWVASGIAMTIIGFVGTAAGAIGGYTISPMISIVLGVAYFVSGIVYSQSWIRNLAIGWWAGSVVMLIWRGSYTLLVFAAMMALLQVVPGIILYLKWKKEYKPNTNG